jgi:hypothetical protein
MTCQVCGLPVRVYRTERGEIALHDGWLPFGHVTHPAVPR